MGICNAILGYFVDAGTINRSLRLRNGRGKTWVTINKNNGIAIPTMRICNTILGYFVDAGTINRPLHLRNGRGKTWVNVAIHNKMGNAKYINKPPRNIHLLRKCMVACTPQGVGADSSRPFFNRTKWFWCVEMIWIAIPTMGICNAILGYFVDVGTMNRPLRLQNGRGKTWVTINKNNGIAIPTMQICNAILCNYVYAGTINRPLQLRTDCQ